MLLKAFLLFAFFSHASRAIDVPSTPSSQSPKNAPLNKTLAYYRLDGYNGPAHQLTHSFINVSCGAVISVHHTDPDVFVDAGTQDRPILLLNHGYPESSYIWRRITPAVSRRVPLVVPDRPGYGLSTVCTNGTDERTTAGAIIDATTAIFGEGKTVILGGHDRGARAMHRAAVDIGQGGFPQIKAAGVFMADIVPIVAEYASFANPRNAVGYFHWSLLPRITDDFSIKLIEAYGGGNFADFLNVQGAGINETAKAQFFADQALETYHTFFDQSSITKASVYDYWNGAAKDFNEMKDDQRSGRKIQMPTHVEYSHYNLVELSGFDVEGVWKDYVDPSAGLTTEGICCGQGHFIIELAPKETIHQLSTFMDRLEVKAEGRSNQVVQHEEL